MSGSLCRHHLLWRFIAAAQGRQQIADRRDASVEGPQRGLRKALIKRAAVGSCVRAGHLDGERTLDFVLRRCGLDYSESGINVGSEIVPKGERAAA